MQKQTLQLKDFGPQPIQTITTLGMEHPQGIIDFRRGRDLYRWQVCRDDSYSLVVGEFMQEEVDDIGFSVHEQFIKIYFWLVGKHTTVLDGFGQFSHDRPEIFMTAGPRDMVKVDFVKRQHRVAAVALCLKREFFPLHMGMQVDELPDALRNILSLDEFPHTFQQFPFTTELLCAVRAIVGAPFCVRGNPLYARAKCTELMFLLMDLMAAQAQKAMLPAAGRRDARLRRAHALLTQRFAEPLTLDGIAREVGLSRGLLTAGFRQLFGTSVYDYVQKRRMETAYELLQDANIPVTRIAASVGFTHQCNFSTAFHTYFGCTPLQSRSRNAKVIDTAEVES